MSKKYVKNVLIPLFVLVLFNPAVIFATGGQEYPATEGVLIWFYGLEAVDADNPGNIRVFWQTAGADYISQKIHRIEPISPQSVIDGTKEGNAVLTIPGELTVTTERPLFLGQVVSLTKWEGSYTHLEQKHNIPIQPLIEAADSRDREVFLRYYPEEVLAHLEDNDRLRISSAAIRSVRDELAAANPRLLDYIDAVDQFVHNQLDYGTAPFRPNNAPDILNFSTGRCGEYERLKQALLRSAGIPAQQVYGTRTEDYGPGIGKSGHSMAHVWSQAYIPDNGWVCVPSTKSIRDPYQLFNHRDGYYIRSVELNIYDDIRIRRYSRIKRVGGNRGNGMFFPLDMGRFEEVHGIVNQLCDYDTLPDPDILQQIARLPVEMQPLLYWFAIALPDETLHLPAATLFRKALAMNRDQTLDSYLIISPQIVKQRILNED